ncbi:MAG: filamentous hemagglutinin N-terminal domain-containing protein [Silvania sp.]|uniref:two-partner secretion domain-containing protein n=1 Tax=Silvania sp. TaxID=3016633 RepID=UPI003EE7BE13
MKQNKNKHKAIKLNPIAASLLLLLPVMAHAADISIINGSITSAANGVTVVNIKEANGNGLSHNIYESLNVPKEGVIFNNAATATDTVLGGQIAANANMAGGTAKVILNEVTSTNASTISGMMEVAGDSAHLIIANPNGITTQGGGFINASKGTLTTGTPNVQDGALAGYSVNGGTITVGGFQSESPTEILARSVKVIGEIKVGELSVVSGSNAINTDGTVTGQVMASGKAGSSYGVDVSRLGGMYANKISLISTESGMGVRNEGTIAGGVSGVNIASNGKLINNKATINSSGNLTVSTNDKLENITGTIGSDKSITINTANNAIANTGSGSISSTENTYITSGALDNTNGKLAAGATLAVNTSGKKLTNSGKAKTAGIEAAVVVLDTGEFSNENGQIHAYYVGSKNTTMNNNSGVIDSYENVEIDSTGNIDNVSGLIRSNVGTVKLKTTKAIKNNYTDSADTTGAESLGIIAGNGIEMSADYLFNRGGTIASSKDIHVETIRDIDNYQGSIESSENISLKGRKLNTSQSGINGMKGVNIDLSDTYDSRIGVVTSTDGDVVIKAKNVKNSSSVILAKNINIQSQSDMNNQYSMMVADENLTLNAAGNITASDSYMFGPLVGRYLGFANQDGGLISGTGVDITAKSLNNKAGRIVAQTGDININLTGDMASSYGQVAANAGNVTIAANKINADYGTLYSSGDLRIDAKGLTLKGDGSIVNNTARGIIASDSDVVININGDFHNRGWISGKNDVTVTTTGNLNNDHTISADANLTLKGKNVGNGKDYSAKKTLTITSDNDLKNYYGSNISGETTVVNAKNIVNYGNLVADSVLNVTASDNIYNYSKIYTQGNAVINTNKVYNNGFWAVVGGEKGLQTTAKIVNIFGKVVGK